MIPQNQYVERLIGFKEHPDDIPSLVRASFIAVFTLIQINPFKTGNGSETFSIVVKEEADGVYLHSMANDKLLKVGTFAIVAVKDLPTFAPLPGVNGTFNVVIGNGERTTDFKKIDVGALQADPENKGATFQVASNFNCLEFMSSKGSAKQGITKYVYDMTQGPAASISAAPGTLYRNYFVRHTPEDSPNSVYIGQCERQINLLERYPMIPVINGYIEFEDVTWAMLQTSGFSFKDISDVKVGVQKGVQVTSGTKIHGKVEVNNDSSQVINQVFTAAMHMGNGISRNWRDTGLPEKVARFVLRGAYRATILSAIENSRTQPTHFRGKNKCFLTLIGGGAFGNQYEWIADAILENLDLIRTSGLQVHLIIFTPGMMDDYVKLRFMSAVEALGGTFANVKNHRPVNASNAPVTGSKNVKKLLFPFEFCSPVTRGVGDFNLTRAKTPYAKS